MVYLRCENPGPRLTYVADFIFGHVLGVAHEWVGSNKDIHLFSLGLGGPASPGAPFVTACGHIESIRLDDPPPIPTALDDMPVIFSSGGGAGYPFDIFAAVFYCLSRVEEYGACERDNHGRFPAKASVFHRWVRRPYVDEWIRHFAHWLVSVGILSEEPKPKSQWLNTIDIDVAYAYRGRGLLRQLGACSRDLITGHPQRLRERIKVLRGLQRDPYDTYSVVQSAGATAASTLFFVLSGKRQGLDINLDPHSGAMRSLISELTVWAEVGIHPSYASLQRPDLARQEKASLEKWTKQDALASRQHFLRFDLPDTFRHHAEMGIQREYSMGFADEIGFRSGTAFAHPFFDLLENKPISIQVVPLIAMDSALKNYLNLSPEAAYQELVRLWQAVIQTGGTMTTVWHNHSISDRGDWKGWQEVYIRFSDLVGYKS